MLGIYVHLPFCESKCNYCAFNSFVASEEEKEKYLSVLIEDISFFVAFKLLINSYPHSNNCLIISAI